MAVSKPKQGDGRVQAVRFWWDRDSRRTVRTEVECGDFRAVWEVEADNERLTDEEAECIVAMFAKSVQQRRRSKR